MSKVYMLTGNPVKFSIAQKIFSDFQIEIGQITDEPIEIQSLDPAEVAIYAARTASSCHGVPVFKSDVAYKIQALNSFPGALVKFANETLTSEDWLRLVPPEADRRLTIREVLALAWPDGTIKVFEQNLSARLAQSAQGVGGSINQVVILEGFDKPLGTYSEEEMLRHWIKTQTVYTDLANWVSQSKGS